jgi:hypothetical protein
VKGLVPLAAILPQITPVSDHEDLSEVDQLSVHLYVEHQEALDIQEAIRRNNLLDK